MADLKALLKGNFIAKYQYKLVFRLHWEIMKTKNTDMFNPLQMLMD